MAKRAKRVPVIWRVTRTLIVLAGLLITAVAVVLMLNPRIKPKDLLAPFAGGDWVAGRDGLERFECLHPHDCAEMEPEQGCAGGWTCSKRRCEWRCAPVRGCVTSHKDDCGPDEFCDAYYCSPYASGQCVQRPTECPETEQIVCGCDGELYLNDCERQRAGVAHRYVTDPKWPCLPEGRTFVRGPAEARIPGEPEEREPRCCCKLRAIPVTRQGREGCFVDRGGQLQICTACGDGRCGVGEDRCNCPRDCRPPEAQPP